MSSTCKTKPIEIKQGASLRILGRIPTAFADGYFVGWDLASQMRNAKTGALLADLTIEWDNPATTRVLVITCDDTAGWAPCEAEFDIRLTSPDDFKLYTRTAQAYVLKGVTQDA